MKKKIFFCLLVAVTVCAAIPKKSDYERGLEDGIEGVSLVNLERQMLKTNWSFLQISNIVKERMMKVR